MADAFMGPDLLTSTIHVAKESAVTVNLIPSQLWYGANEPLATLTWDKEDAS